LLTIFSGAAISLAMLEHFRTVGRALANPA